MHEQQPIRVAVFDLGGVLVRADRTWVDGARLLGYDVDPDWLAAFELRRKDFPRRGAGEIENAAYCELLASVADGLFAAEDFVRMHAASLNGEYERIHEVFDALDAAEIVTAVLSNTDATHWARMFPSSDGDREFPTLARVQHPLASHLLGIEKPDERAYRAVEAVTGATGSEILFFDDREENVAAARVLGWLAEHIDHEGDTAEQMLAVLRRLGMSSSPRYA